MQLRVILSILLIPLTAAAQTKPASLEAERLVELAKIVAEVAMLPQLKVDSIPQVVKFSIEEDMLAVRTSLLKCDDPTHVIVPGLEGLVRLKTFGEATPEEAGENFQLLEQDLTKPSRGQVYTWVSSAGGRIIISRDAEVGEELTSVQLVQDPPAMLEPGAEPPVRLLVDRTDLHLKLDANSFVELRLKYPRDVDEYLLPILRSFKQEVAVLRVDPSIAWQVLGGEVKTDAQLLAKINAIIPKLDADDFRQREAAMRDLKNLGQPGAIALMKMDRSKLSLQQSSALDTVLADFDPLPAEQIGKLAREKSFLLDVLYNDDPVLQKLTLERLSKIEGRNVELDAKLEKSDAIAKLRRGIVPATREKQ